MKNPMGQTNELVDHLINSVVQKLQANREILSRSVNYGRLVWRRNKKDDQIEVDLELKLLELSNGIDAPGAAERLPSGLGRARISGLGEWDAEVRARRETDLFT